MRLLLCVFGIVLPLAFATPQDDYPELYSGFLDGDMLLSHGQRIGLIEKDRYWPNGEIPYIITGDYNERELSILNNAFSEFKRKTCIVFRPKQEEDEDFINIKSKYAGCFASVGKDGGEQNLNLYNSCFNNNGTAIHEMMHAVGFHHEHLRPDRDDYVTIHFENMLDGSDYMMDKLDLHDLSLFNVTYDYGSIMHYPRWSYSKNGKDVIVPKDPSANIGQRESLSEKDALKINRMYECTEFLP